MPYAEYREQGLFIGSGIVKVAAVCSSANA